MDSSSSKPLLTLLRGSVVLAAVLVADAARAQGTPHGDDFQVNSYTTSFQAFPAVGTDAAGNFVVAWTSYGSDGGDTSYASVQAQRFGADGAPRGGQLQLNTFTTGMQAFSVVAAQPESGFVVAWTSYGSAGSDGDGYSVQARRDAADGAPPGPQFQVNDSTTGTQCCAAVAARPKGDFVVVWSSDVSAGTDTSSSSIQAQRFDAEGTPIGGELQVNSYTTSAQGAVAVAAEVAGGFVAVWTSDGSSGTDTSFGSIQVRRFDASSVPRGDDLQVNTYTSNTQRRPRVAVATDGTFVVVWESFGSDGGDTHDASVQARIFDAGGAPLGPQFQVNSYSTNAQERPAVTADERGFVVVWASAGSFGTDADGASIQARSYRWDGSPLEGELQVNSYTTGAQSSPTVAADPDGDLVIAWQSNGSAGTDTASTSIQARRFDALFRDDLETGDSSRWTATVP